MKKVLAFDMGATSIRGILGYIEDGKFCIKEVMRMTHKIQKRDGRLYWDWKDRGDHLGKSGCSLYRD